MPHAWTQLKFENSANSLCPRLLPDTSLLCPFTQASRRKLNASWKIKTCPVMPGLPMLVPISAVKYMLQLHTTHPSVQETDPWSWQEQEFQLCFHEKLVLPHFHQGRWVRNKSRDGCLIRRWMIWSDCSLPSCWEKHLSLTAGTSPCGVSKTTRGWKGGFLN